MPAEIPPQGVAPAWRRLAFPHFAKPLIFPLSQSRGNGEMLPMSPLTEFPPLKRSKIPKSRRPSTRRLLDGARLCLRPIILLLAVVLLCVCGMWWKRGCPGRDIVLHWVRARLASRSVDQAVARVYAARPEVRALAESAGDALQILVFKHESLVEVSAPGWDAPRIYPMTARSGTLGPKLREGDRQIPEGIYRVESLNPNSLYHLSLRLDYPNGFDRARAAEDGRTDLGGDIMIHGSDRSVGCVAVGDPAIEEVFCCASAVRPENVAVIIAPYDMRLGPQPDLAPPSAPSWYPDLCASLRTALSPLPSAGADEAGPSP